MRLADLRDYVAALLPQYDVFYSYMPDEPHDCISLFKLGTSSPDPYLIGFDEEGFQVRVRAKWHEETGSGGYDLAEQMVLDAKVALNDLKDVQIGDRLVRYILFDSGPIGFGYDENERYEMTLNFRYR